MTQYRNYCIATIFNIALLFSGNSANAHHSFAAEFDPDSTGQLTGIVTYVRFSNPHVRYRIEVKSEAGSSVIWELHAPSVTALRQQNWTRDTLQIGNEVTVQGQLGRNGAKKLFIRDGTLLKGGDDGAEGGTLFGTALGSLGNIANPRKNPNKVYADLNKDYGRGQLNPTHPFDISGAWRNSYKFRVTVDDLEPKPTPYTAEGLRLRNAINKYDDPGLRCIALGLPRLFGGPYNMDIYDAGDHYLFLYVQDNSTRRIWMNEQDSISDNRPTSNGYSVGHWQDDLTLVIETTHLLPAWLDGSGLPMSGTGTRIVERYSFGEDHLSADKSMTIYDPLYTTPLVRIRGMAREDNLDVSEQDSCDPASYYSDLYESDLLEQYLSP